MVVLLAVLIAAAAAWAAGTKPRLKLTGPSGTLAHNKRYKVKASGRATQKANTVFAYEGGQVRGGTAAIQCYSTEKAEYAHYKPSPTVHVYLGAHPVQGAFSLTWKFAAVNPGPRAFCAYLASSSGNKTYKHAELHWTNAP
ncbi:MAG TPA: hypothetical protein VE983_00445 [Solirubrobacteraceae bacterium]|nr:hypothetical protein [Solirubrobacteraceae bacterium]